jgi:hypothetical protein
MHGLKARRAGERRFKRGYDKAQIGLRSAQCTPCIECPDSRQQTVGTLNRTVISGFRKCVIDINTRISFPVPQYYRNPPSSVSRARIQMPDSESPTSQDRIRRSGSTNGSYSLDEKRYEVWLEPEDDPQRLSLFRRWLAIATISSSGNFVTFASSVVRFWKLGSLRARSSF